MCSKHPKEWSKWIPLVEWWYNTTYHTATELTPYEVIYNQPPPMHLPYIPGETKVEAVDRSLQRREAVIQVLKFHLLKAQHRMKMQVDAHRPKREFNIGDWVWLKLQPYKQQSVQHRPNHKLSTKFYGPFQVLAKVGKVVYTLQLSPQAQIHATFHVSQLKGFRGVLPAQPHIPEWLQGSNVKVARKSVAIFDRRLVKYGNGAKVKYLVQWEGQAKEDAA